MEGANAASLPTTTFTDRFSLLDGLDRIELYHFGPGHTDGAARLAGALVAPPTTVSEAGRPC